MMFDQDVLYFALMRISTTSHQLFYFAKKNFVFIQCLVFRKCLKYLFIVGEKMNKKVLWISMMAPYDSVGHASGKTENYYLKYVQVHSEFQMVLMTLCGDYEVQKLDLDKYGIKNKIYVRKREGIYGFIRRGIAWLSKFNIINKYAGLTSYDISYGIKKMLHELVNENFIPDCIILQWTEILFMFPEIKKLYPNVPIIAIEEDVSYLGQLRRWQYEKKLLKIFYKYKYLRVKRIEIKYLNQVDLVVLNNQKDYKLIMNDGVKSRIFIWSVYFESLLHITPKNTTRDIVYYGAMSREENWKSAEWFILNVMPFLDNKEIRFVIIGSNPNHKLYQYCNDRIIVKGYVDDISKELVNSMCLVAPLLLGAGIKVKVIEALSCGIPVLTNSIGIEGIPAVDGKSYFHCETPQDYINIINKLDSGKVDIQAIAENGKQVVRDNFNYENSAKIFIEKLRDLVIGRKISCNTVKK